MREHTLVIPGHENFVVKTPLGVDKYKDWFDDAVSNKDKLLRISKELDRIEEAMFLQAATECEKDFYFLKDNIDIDEYLDDKNGKEYLVLPTHCPDGWCSDW